MPIHGKLGALSGSIVTTGNNDPREVTIPGPLYTQNVFVSGSFSIGGHAVNDLTVNGDSFGADDDHLATAQAIKAYVDAQTVASLGGIGNVDTSSKAAGHVLVYDLSLIHISEPPRPY